MSVRTLSLLGLIVLAGCTPTQSAFHPTGAEAERVATLFWIMTVGGAIILAMVVAATAMALFGNRTRHWLATERLVTIMGLGFPVVVLTALLIYGFAVMRAGDRPQLGADGTRVEIAGELWWWRVTYFTPDGRVITSANELHVPVGEPVQIDLVSDNVIHSFWAPQLAGKLDMIPGRTNSLTVTATKPGISRGQCAEFCGGAHALMAFDVIAHPPDDFADWLDAAAAPAVAPATDRARNGEDIFFAAGCGSCHAVRGTRASGVVGPDLTHVGSRQSLAAATLPNTAEGFANWIGQSQHIKPENKMPAYRIFSDDQLADLSAYLEGLQ